MVARSRGSHYDIQKLVKACRRRSVKVVFVRTKAQESAKKFDLDTEKKIIDFIATGVFEDIQHDNTGTINEGQDAGILFDAYTFRIGPKYVYFAFYQKPNGNWIVKSFHPPEKGEKAPPLSHTPFSLLEGLKK